MLPSDPSISLGPFHTCFNPARAPHSMHPKHSKQLAPREAAIRGLPRVGPRGTESWKVPQGHIASGQKGEKDVGGGQGKVDKASGSGAINDGDMKDKGIEPLNP